MDPRLAFVLIVGVSFFVLLLIYCVHIQLRRRKYKQIADELGAEYQSQGLFNTGIISGASDHRKYSIENRDVPQYKASHTWTIIKMQCVNKGIPLEIHRGFFKDFPNWNCAFTRGNRTEKILAVNVHFENMEIKLEGKQKIEVQGLFQEISLLDSAVLKKGQISIEQDTLSFAIRGVLKKLEVIRQILSVLTTVADRIESAPIV